MLKLFHFVLVTAIKGEYIALPQSIRAGENLAHLYHLETVFQLLLCDSATQAHQIAQQWNNTFKTTGIYTQL